jgi:uncharacterized membrane protein YgcG
LKFDNMVQFSALIHFLSILSISTLAAASVLQDGQKHSNVLRLNRRAGSNVVPTAPGPGDSFRVGQQCTMTWTAGTAGRWKEMTIDLMTGANQAMVKVTNVASNIDGTSLTSYSWTCPDVSPNSAIYFYQFTDKNGANPTWTTRFTIASSDGSTTTPSNADQPNGDAIPWGTGALASGSGSSSSSDSSSSSSSSSGSSSSSSGDNSSSSSSNSEQDSNASSSSGSSQPASTGTTSSSSQSGSSSSSGANTLSSCAAFAGVVAVAVGALLA